MADNGTPGTPAKIAAREKQRTEKEKRQEEARQKHYAFVDDEANWEYVEVPETDLFDKPYGYIGINTETYGPGKHFVDPDIASELKRIMRARHLSDQRVYRPTKDQKTLDTMARQGKPITHAGVSADAMDAAMRKETGM